jgi:UrcA family protein
MTKTIASALLAAAFLSTAAFAQTDRIDVSAASVEGVTQTAAVHANDLDLTRRADQVQLRIRVAQAVDHVCTFSDRFVDKGCAGEAASNARIQTNAAIAEANGARLASATVGASHGAN